MMRIFISSVQKELEEERRAIKDFILGDPLMRRFIDDVFLFEDIPASDQRSDHIYLAEVGRRDLYLAILGNQYGWKNAEGKSSTELEFDHATATGRERLVFVKGDDDKPREPDMARLVKKAGSQLTRRGLPEPAFEQNGAHFVITLWRDWLTTAVVERLGLNERQKKILALLKQMRRITNSEYRELTGCTRPTAKRDLDDLVGKRVLTRSGSGRGAHYEAPAKRLSIGLNGSLQDD